MAILFHSREESLRASFFTVDDFLATLTAFVHRYMLYWSLAEVLWFMRVFEMFVSPFHF